MKSDTSKCREVFPQHIEQFRVNLGEELIHKIAVQIESQEEREKRQAAINTQVAKRGGYEGMK